MTNKATPPIASLASKGLPPELLVVLNQLYIRTGGPNDTISDIEVTQIAEDGGNRSYRRHRDEIQSLNGDIAQLKRLNRTLEQIVYELVDMCNQTKRQNKLTEQKLTELIERYDSGA